ncbi:MAG: carboxypeptidase regulatory-like domain-containing protein [Planctomycetes bacterium]|nr:carboxypeptidase regulatory-like domain-containing protein [Planctomycetota bacterium]
MLRGTPVFWTEDNNLLPRVLNDCFRLMGAADRQPTAPVSGVVTHLGKPVEGATVTFIPATNPVPAYGLTDEEGRFALSTYEEHDGAIIGQHTVTITKTTGTTPSSTPPSTGNDDPEDFENYVPPSLGVTPPPVVKHLIPERYSEPETSGLTATVTSDGANTFTFEL